MNVKYMYSDNQTRFILWLLLLLQWINIITSKESIEQVLSRCYYYQISLDVVADNIIIFATNCFNYDYL